MKNSFHGRTLGALAATGQAKYQKGFEPLPKGFKIVEFNNFNAVSEAISDKTVAIIITAACGLTIEQIAAKDVPTGQPYKIVDVADIPTDRQWRDEWTLDAADLTDGVGE